MELARNFDVHIRDNLTKKSIALLEAEQLCPKERVKIRAEILSHVYGKMFYYILF